MPTMIRKNGRAKQIAYDIIGKPENLKEKSNTYTKRDSGFYRRAKYSNVFTEVY